MNTALMFSSKSDEWSTPQDLFDALHAEFDFQIDLAATPENAKCPLFYTAAHSALAGDWHRDAAITRGWLNPPYSRGLCSQFIAKAAAERLRGFLTVMLLPARTDTQMFHTHIYDATQWHARDGVEIRFLPGRLKFGGCKDAAPFPSMVAVFRPLELPSSALDKPASLEATVDRFRRIPVDAIRGGGSPPAGGTLSYRPGPPREIAPSKR